MSLDFQAVKALGSVTGLLPDSDGPWTRTLQSHTVDDPSVNFDLFAALFPSCKSLIPCMRSSGEDDSSYIGPVFDPVLLSKISWIVVFT